MELRMLAPLGGRNSNTENSIRTSVSFPPYRSSFHPRLRRPSCSAFEFLSIKIPSVEATPAFSHLPRALCASTCPRVEQPLEPGQPGTSRNAPRNAFCVHSARVPLICPRDDKRTFSIIPRIVLFHARHSGSCQARSAADSNATSL